MNHQASGMKAWLATSQAALPMAGPAQRPALRSSATCQLSQDRGVDRKHALQAMKRVEGIAWLRMPQTVAAPNRISPASHGSKAACQQQCRSVLLAVMDTAPEWTLDQIAGLAFGFILVASVLLAYKVDEAFARSQRRDLGICEECGGVFEAKSCEEKRCPLQSQASDLD